MIHYVRSLHFRLSLMSEAKSARLHGHVLPRDIRKRILKEPHHQEEHIWLLRFIPKGARLIILDIGGNSGYWAESILAYFPESFVFGFEPVSEMFSAYRKRFEHNPRVKVFNTAIGDRNEFMMINIDQGYSLASFYTYAEGLEHLNQYFLKQERVKVSLLDEFEPHFSEIQADYRVIKVDVQGFESKVVKGGIKVFEKADAVIVECSFINEFEGQMPSFGEIVTSLSTVDLHPVQFGIFDTTRSSIAYERNVLFIKRKWFDFVWDK